MDSGRVFEEAFRTLEKKEVAVIRNVHGFPERDKHIISPYLTLLICHSGSSRALYDMQEVVFRPNEVAMVLPNHIISPIERSPDYSTTIIMHSLAFEQEMTQRRMTHDRNKFHKLPACLLTNEEMAQYMKAVELLEIISETPVSRYPHRHDMLLAQTRNRSIFNVFCNQVAIHYREQHEVAFYAENAHLTTRHFSVIIKEVIGLSASDYIEQYLAIQAKNLLSSRPDLSVQQISDHLGYADSSSFCRFFKRATGLSPRQFREQEWSERQ